MVSPETEPQHKPELIESIFASAPPLPLGIADISHLKANAEAEAAGYSWDQVPSWLAEILGTYSHMENIPIVCLDVCSSVPRHTQRLRIHEFSRDGERGRELARAFLSEDTVRKIGRDSEQLKMMTSSAMKARASGVDYLQDLLASGIQRAIYTLTHTEWQRIDEGGGSPSDLLKHKLWECIANQKSVYVQFDRDHERRFEEVEQDKSYLEAVGELRIPTPLAGFSRMLLMTDASNDKDLDQQTARITEPAGPVLARQYVEWQVDQLAEIIAANKRYRPARFVSMDSALPDEIAGACLNKTGEAVSASPVLSHSLNSLYNPNQHFQGNMFEELPFPDNSLAVISCFDGWPFHFMLDDAVHGADADFVKVAVDTLEAWYQKLAFGGKIVIFPWAIKSSNYADAKSHRRYLDLVEVGLAERLDHKVSTETLHANTLRNYMMSPIDADVASAESDVMNILNHGNQAFKVFVITKPPKKSFANRTARREKRSKMSAFNQESVD